jgi:hypothetical protein
MPVFDGPDDHIFLVPFWSYTSRFPLANRDACASVGSCILARVTGETKYGIIENIKAIEDANIHASISPVGLGTPAALFRTRSVFP